MTLWIFDTDRATLFGQGNPQIVQRVSAVNPKDIAITIVTFALQMYGRLNRIRRATSGEERISAYASLRKTVNYLTDFELLDFDRESQHYTNSQNSCNSIAPGASPPVNLKEYPQSLSDAPGAQVSANKPTLIIVAFWRRELVLPGIAEILK